MKKIIIILALLFLSVAFLSAAPGEYDTLKAFILQQTKVTEDYVANLEKATDATQFAAIIIKIKDDLNAMIPTFKILIEKYPNFEKLMTTEVPEELKADVEKMKALSQKMQPLFMTKFGQYQQEEVVTKAFAELMQANQALTALAPKPEEPAAPPPPPAAPEEKK